MSFATTMLQGGLTTNEDLGAVELYLSGCYEPHCPGCHNPELWSFNEGVDIQYERLHVLAEFYKRLFILGGEPLDQNPFRFMVLLEDLRRYYEELWLFTRYDIHSVPKYVKDKVDFIKCGPFLQWASGHSVEYFGVKLASSNQLIYRKNRETGEFVLW